MGLGFGRFAMLDLSPLDCFACEGGGVPEAASLRSRILHAVRDGDAETLENLCGHDPEAPYFAERFQWLVDSGKKALPDVTPCEMWIRRGRFEPVNCKAKVRNLYREPDGEIVNGYFAEYQGALEAESYQVICANGEKSMRFHELEGYPDGIPADIMPNFFRKLMYLNQHGEMIAFKPFSSKYCYIFIHDVTVAGVEMLLELGIAPAYMQEISKDLHQVIVKIPKTGDSEADKFIEKDMSRALNLIAGDCLPGSKRPHYAPAFTNWRGVEIDGMCPISGVILADGTVCDFLAEYGNWWLENRPAPMTGVFVPEYEPVKADGMALYNAHRDDILHVTHQTLEEADLSDVDMKIATRLRATGHDEEEVAGILAEAGRNSGRKKQNWDTYAAITARTAFSDDRILMKYEKYFERWYELERQAACMPFRDGAMT